MAQTKPTKSFEQKVYEITSKIPEGRVATYKTIARLIKNQKSSRAVGNALHKNPFFPRVPCHRVVNSSGETSEKFRYGLSRQVYLLRREGVEVVDGIVNLKIFGWDGRQKVQ